MSELTSPAGGDVASPQNLNWLEYYSECRHYELVMSQKFIALLGQASVFSITAVAGIFTLAERLDVKYPNNLWIAVPSAIVLAMYAVIIAKYFLQIQATGGIMVKIEKTILGAQAKDFGLIHVLRAPSTAFYNSQPTRWLVRLYVGMLASLPLVAALIL